ncbi:hypothetical protein Clacol_000160 [Clathrus columnatus]|uniref:Uncharacterized protein n=1 Tax=Clathrus columnatus TaxID=1419009 RepID=A0AAV4ZXY7_9AGAM|nr:hypothetical protein Clacol_000160 [Clathrus columnatus]
MSSSSTSSKEQAFPLPIASSSSANGWDGVPQIYPNNFFEQVDNNHPTAFHPHDTRSPSQLDQSFLLSSWPPNDDASAGSGMMYGSSKNVINVENSSVSTDREKSVSEGWVTNHQSLPMANTASGFDAFNLSFIDNSRNEVVPSTQHLDIANNGAFFGNQYLPNFDFDFPHVEANNAPSGSSTTSDNFISNAGSSQHSNEPQTVTSTTGYTSQPAIPNISVPSTSEALNGNRNRAQSPLSQMEESSNSDSTTQTFPFLPSTSHSPMGHDENIDVTSTPPSGNKKRYSKSLYTVEKGKYVCRYKGPARPEGCSITSREVRYLCRHLRTHALKEREMGIAEEDRVACNGVPEEFLYLSGDRNNLEGEDFRQMGEGHGLS